MSIVFVKSEDRTAVAGRGNPNKPYRFSNYLTQPLILPKNSQVAYVGSTFNMNTDGTAQTEPFYMLVGNQYLNYPVALKPESERVTRWWELMNNLAREFNQYSLDGDYVSAKTNKAFVYGDITQTCATNGACFLQGVFAGVDKINMELVLRGSRGDWFNFDFNALNGNPSYSSGSWSGSAGGTYPSGINWNFDLLDTEYDDNIRMYPQLPPNGSLTGILKSNCGGLDVNVETRNSNTRNLVYGAGAGYYNTGFFYRSGRETANTWDNYTSNAVDIVSGNLTPPAPYNQGYYQLKIATATGIKKCVGDITPSTDPQISNNPNNNSHQYIGHLGSGGYAIWTHMNTDYARASQRYVNPDFNGAFNNGFTGLYPCSVGVMSIPYVRSFNNDLNTSYANYWADCDLNNSKSLTNPVSIAEGASARYIFGFDIETTGVAGNADLVIQAKCLDFENGGTLKNSKYKNIGKPLSIGQLSLGVNTCGNEGDADRAFSTGADYFIQTSTTNVVPAPTQQYNGMLFFRFRWSHPYQMVIEWTMATEDATAGTRYTGTYDPYHDSLYVPAEPYDPADPTTYDPRDKWVILATMNLPENIGSSNLTKHILIPQYFGDMGLFSSSAFGESGADIMELGHGSKGHYDLRTANRYIENLAQESYGSALYTDPTEDYQFFNNGGMGNETLCYIDDLDDEKSTPKLKIQLYSELEVFGATGNIKKACDLLLNTIKPQHEHETDAFVDVNGNPLFKVNEPQPLLEWGYILGITKPAEDDAVYTMTFADPPNDETIQSITGQISLQTSNLAFSNHIQLTNLPIQSQNGAVNSQNKTIYIINSLCVGKYQDGENYRFYCDTSPQLLWIDLNNVGELNLNKIDVLVTDDENKPQTSLEGVTDLTLMFREKPSRDTGYYPNNIGTDPLRVSLR